MLGGCFPYLTRFAQYALARLTSASEGRADVASFRHGVVWNCLGRGLAKACNRRMGVVEDVNGRIKSFAIGRRKCALCQVVES
jgi:hypothetical protein